MNYRIFHEPTGRVRAAGRTAVAVSCVCAWILCGAIPASGVGPGRAATGSPAESKPEERADTVVYLAPRIVVRARRVDPLSALGGPSGFVARIDMADRRNRVEDIAEILSRAVGVRVKQYGGFGGFATVSIRGSSASQVNVYLDGVPLNDPFFGTSNLADLPVGALERIEVYRGFSPLQLGSGAVGGAVNLVTRAAFRAVGEGTGASVDAVESYGSFDTSRHQGTVRAARGRLSAFLHTDYRRSLGDFGFVDDEGTPQNALDDVVATRANNDFTALNTVARLECDVPYARRLFVQYDRLDRDQGVPGLGTDQSLTARSRRRRDVWHVDGASAPFFGGTTTLSGSVFYSKATEQFDDPDADIGLMAQRTDNTLIAHGGRSVARCILPRLRPIPATVISLVFDGRKDRFHPIEKVPRRREGPDRWRLSRTLAAGLDAYIFDQSLVLSVSQRWERHTSEFYDAPAFPWMPPSPRGRISREVRTPGVGFRWRPHSSVTFKGNAGRYYRTPTFLELFGNAGSITGAAELLPETGTNSDVGVVVSIEHAGHFRRLFLEATRMWTSVEDMILFFPNSQRTAKATNIGAADIAGWELSAAFESPVRPAGSARVSGSYTRMDTRDTSDIPYYRGRDLPARPRDEISLATEWSAGRWRTAYDLHWIGRNFLDRANMQEISSRALHNFAVSYRPPIRGLSLTLEARNISNDRVSDVAGFPLPGRTLFATASYSH